MRKFSLLSLLVALFATLSANAKTVYWDNTGTGWSTVIGYSWSPDYNQTLTATTIDGHQVYAATLNNEKIIFKGEVNWSDPMQTADLPVTDGYVYGKQSIKSNGGSIEPIAIIKDGKWTAYVAPVEAPAMYIVGEEFGSWGASASCKLHSEDGKTYTLEGVNFNKGKEFKFFGGSWGTRELTGAGDAVVPNTTYNLASGSANMATKDNITNATIKLVCNEDYSKATFQIITESGEQGGEQGGGEQGGETPDPAKTIVELIGIANNWTTAKASGEVDSESNCATFTVENWDATWGFKFRIGNNYYGNKQVLTNGDWIDKIGDGGEGDTLIKLDASAAGKTVTFTVAADHVAEGYVNAKADWAETGDVEPELYFGVVGTMTQTKWDIENPIDMTAEEGVYTATFASLPKGTLFKIVRGKTWDGSFGAEGTLDQTEAIDVPVTLGVAANAWAGSNNNFLIENALENATIEFTYIIGENVPSKVTVSGTVITYDSVNGIYLDAEDVEYYNINGVRVQNPKAGLYIVRQGNKTSKVVIR